MEAPELTSPRLRTLAEAVASGHPTAADAFWAEMTEAGTPLVEPAEEEGSALVTLLARRTDEHPRLWVSAIGLGGLAPADREMRLLDGTDVLYWTQPAPRDLRTVYAFAHSALPADEVMLADPLARQPYVYPGDDEVPDDHDITVAFLELPDARPLPWSTESGDVPRGRVELHRIEPKRLGRVRRLYTYEPAGCDPAAGPYPLLILHDGWAFTQFVRANVTLDNLIHVGAIPPLVAVMPDSPDLSTRLADLSLSDEYNDFLADELLPWAHQRWNLSMEPSQVVAAGGSLGGTAAVYQAMQRPDVVGCAISLSGAFQVMPKGDPEPIWVARELARRDRMPIRLWLNAGSLETVAFEEHVSLLAANRHLRDVLTAKGYEFSYSEFPGGHDYFWWVETMADGLIALLGPTGQR